MGKDCLDIQSDPQEINYINAYTQQGKSSSSRKLFIIAAHEISTYKQGFYIRY